jgi:dUTP pyrophosphatase
LNVVMHISVQKLDKELPTPARAHADDAGLDLYSAQTLTLEPGERAAVGTGLAISLPAGFAGLVTPRSGLAARAGLSIVNAPGLIDAGYRGEIKVILINLGQDPVRVGRGDRIAQLVIIAVSTAVPVVVDDLDETARGVDGFGSTGT